MSDLAVHPVLLFNVINEEQAILFNTLFPPPSSHFTTQTPMPRWGANYHENCYFLTKNKMHWR